MSNAVTQRGASSTALAGLASLKQGLANVAQTMPVSSIDPYLRLLQDGGWVYGQENIDVEPGSLWAVNPLSLRHGWACWTDYPEKMKKKNEKLGERMVAMTVALPDFNDLPEFVDEKSGDEWEWKQQISFSLVCLTGEDKGVQVLYPVRSVGGMNAAQKLINDIIKQIGDNPDRPVPVVELMADHYPHKNYGKTYFPVIRVDHWVSMTDDMPDVHAAEEDRGVGGAAIDEGGQAGGERAEPEPETAAPRQRRQAAPASEPTARGRDARTAATHAAPQYDNAAPAAADPAQPRRTRRTAETTGGQAAPQETAQADAPADAPVKRTRRFA